VGVTDVQIAYSDAVARSPFRYAASKRLRVQGADRLQAEQELVLSRSRFGPAETERLATGGSRHATVCRSLPHETFLPAPDAGLRLARPTHDFDRADAVRPIADSRLKATPVKWDKSDEDPGAHAPDSHTPESWESVFGIQRVRFGPLDP